MDDHDRPHYFSRDLEDLADFDESRIFDARTLEEQPSPTHESEGPGDPEPRDVEPASIVPAYGVPGVPETWPSETRRSRPLPAHERRPLPARMRSRGIACVVVMFSDGRKVVLR